MRSTTSRQKPENLLAAPDFAARSRARGSVGGHRAPFAHYLRKADAWHARR